MLENLFQFDTSIKTTKKNFVEKTRWKNSGPETLIQHQFFLSESKVPTYTLSNFNMKSRKHGWNQSRLESPSIFNGCPGFR